MTTLQKTSSPLKSAHEQLIEAIKRLDVPPDHILKRMFSDEKRRLAQERSRILREREMLKAQCDAAMTRLFLSVANGEQKPRGKFLDRIRNGDF